MKYALILATVLAGSTAAAQPAARPQCAVTILRAPDDVRTVVESWVQAEPNCNTKLEVRIVATEGGLYLLARDDSGRLRERVVPDAQSAGVLVASWVAADSSAAPPPVVAPEPAMPPVMPPVAPPSAAPPALAPSAEAYAPGAAPAIAATPRVRQRWLALGAMTAMSGTGGGGVRGEWDVKTRGWATFGLAGSVSQSGIEYYGYYGGYGTMDMVDTKVLGYLGLTNDWGKWHLRSSIGLGAVYTRAMLDNSSGSQEASGLFPTGELTLSIGRDITSNWGLSAGPVVSIYAQQYNVDEMGPGYYSSSTENRELEAMMFFAMRHRL
jgi:hypothetical protein